jgi:hypothetical protein
VRFLLVLPAISALAGCGTITRGTTEQVQILSNPPDAVATTSLGHSCRTPCTLTVSRKDEFVVSVRKDGFEPAQVPVTTALAGTGGAAFAGNILLGGVVGMGTDVVTGAALDHAPNPVSVALAPESPPPPAPARLSAAEPPRRRNVSIVARTAPSPAPARPSEQARRE